MFRKGVEFAVLALLFGAAVESLTTLSERESFDPRRAAALGLAFSATMTGYVALRERIRSLRLRLTLFTMFFVAVLWLAVVVVQGEGFGWDVVIWAVIGGAVFAVLDAIEALRTRGAG